MLNELLELGLPAEQTGQAATALVAVGTQEDVTSGVGPRAEVGIEPERRGEKRAEHVGIADLVAVDEQPRRLRVAFVGEAGERLHDERCAHDDEQVAARKIAHVLPELAGQTFAEQYHVGLDHALLARAAFGHVAAQHRLFHVLERVLGLAC